MSHIEELLSLYKTDRRRLIGLIYNYVKIESEAEDIVQDAVVKAFRKIDTFRGDSSLKSWLNTIVVNTARNRYRSKIRTKLVELSDSIEKDQEHYIVKSDVEEDIFIDQRRALVLELIRKLPPAQRKVLELRMTQDMNIKEVAMHLEANYSTVKANSRHGYLKIRELLK